MNIVTYKSQHNYWANYGFFAMNETKTYNSICITMKYMAEIYRNTKTVERGFFCFEIIYDEYDMTISARAKLGKKSGFIQSQH